MYLIIGLQRNTLYSKSNQRATGFLRQNLPSITDQWKITPETDLKASTPRHHPARCNEYILVLLFFLVLPNYCHNNAFEHIATLPICQKTLPTPYFFGHTPPVDPDIGSCLGLLRLSIILLVVDRNTGSKKKLGSPDTMFL